MTTATAEKAPRDRLEKAVGELATQMLGEAEAVTAERLVERISRTQARLIDAVAKQEGSRILSAIARSLLKQRADSPLQQELDLGLPPAWTLRVRREDGRVYYVLAEEATEDDLLGAEAERLEAVKKAQTRVASAEEGAQRALDRAQANLEAIRVLLGRLPKAKTG